MSQDHPIATGAKHYGMLLLILVCLWVVLPCSQDEEQQDGFPTPTPTYQATMFMEVYDGHEIWSVLQDNDDCYLATGLLYTGDEGSLSVMKTDRDGTLIWLKSYGSEISQRGRGICLTDDDNCWVLGDQGDLLKIDREGSLLETIRYSGQGDSCAQTLDGGLVFAGSHKDAHTQEDDIFVEKRDRTGLLEWRSSFGAMRNDMCRKVLQTMDGAFVVCGYRRHHIGYATVAFLCKLTPEGSIAWVQEYPEHTYSYDVIQTVDGGFMLLGDRGFLLKLSAEGELAWTAQYGSYFNHGDRLVELPDGTYILCGGADSTSGDFDVAVYHLDAQGHLIWRQLHGIPDAHEYASCLTLTRDNGFLMGGYRVIENNEWQSLMVKTNQLGEIGSHERM